jgi:hypothetical protein
MKLSQCTHGTIVEMMFGEKGVDSYMKIGMIWDITETPDGDPRPVVKWQDGGYTNPHNFDLELYED